MDTDRSSSSSSSSSSPASSHRLPNGFALPKGQRIPNAIFVGGIDSSVDEDEMGSCFAQFGRIKDVKIIMVREGLSKGYGFVYFEEDVDIESIIEQQITINGRKLKLGPAIVRDKSHRATSARPTPYVVPQLAYNPCCSPNGGNMSHLSPILIPGNSYNQVYPCPSMEWVMMPQMPVNFGLNPCGYYILPPLVYTTAPWMTDQSTCPGIQERLNFVDINSLSTLDGNWTFNRRHCSHEDVPCAPIAEEYPTLHDMSTCPPY